MGYFLNSSPHISALALWETAKAYRVYCFIYIWQEEQKQWHI